MIVTAQSICTRLEEELLLIDTSNERIVSAQLSISATKRALIELKNLLDSKSFKNNQEEIFYFKTIQPKVLCHHLYFFNTTKYFNRIPFQFNAKMIKKLCKDYLKSIKLYYNENQEFITYYLSGDYTRDSIYFLRGFHPSNLLLDECSAFIDSDKTTGYDFILARYLAYERLRLFFNQELTKTKNPQQTPYIGHRIPNEKKLNWTDKKNGLVELLYALKESGSINNGNCSLEEIAKSFETIFEVKLGNFYNTFQEICRRENPTQFIDKLKERLESKVDETLN